ncbi:MAG: sulfatase [Phycisphaerae bacterium]
MRILYLDLDALTPWHLGCYGYHRNTSPTIDRIAAEGVRCTNVYAPDAPCLPSRTAFYSGRFGINTGVVGHGGTAAQPRVEGPDRSFRDHFDTQGFARQLQHAGMHTAMISPFGQRHAAWHFYAGFNEIHNTGGGGMESAEQVQPVVSKWLDEHAAEDNWYLHINYWDVHTPYRVPADYGDPFKDEPLPDWLTEEEVARQVKQPGPHSCQDYGMYHGREDPKFSRHPGTVTDMAGARKAYDGYDTAIRYVDDMIAQIVAMLKKAGVYDETAIIISADHGENMGELRIWGEHGTADRVTCNVPMIIKWPGAKQGHVDEGLHYNLDFAPTCLQMLGRDDLIARCPIWDGKSYADTLKNGVDAGREELVISQCAHVCQRSVRMGDWLYMRTYHDGFHCWPKEMLFDLKTDPQELNNVAGANPEICREAGYRLLGWHDEQMAKVAAMGYPDKSDPMVRVLAEGGPFHANVRMQGQPGPVGFFEYLERLEATGRGASAAVLREQWGDEAKKYQSLYA